jgi:hypothetical protein
VEEMVITIKDDKIEVEVTGVRGTRCLELTRAVEQMLGKADSRLLKQDYYRTTEARQRIDIKHLSSSRQGGMG